tara:strand:+ start:693 stop:881 length:189 start_codon:yes stop_codon:yes gene_type:complete
MKLPEVKHATGVSTIGLTGVTILAGIIFADLSVWWIIVSVLCIMSAIGLEAGTTDAVHRKDR